MPDIQVNRETLKALKEKYIQINPSARHQASSLKLPSGSRFKLNSRSVTIYLSEKNVCQNVQTDGAAFEGWALAFKHLFGEIDNFSVKLAWDPPDKPSNSHYQRFLYRIIHFNATIPWFTIDNSCEGELKKSIVLTPAGNNKKPMGYFKLNPASRKRPCNQVDITSKVNKKLTENQIEILFCSNPYKLENALQWGTMEIFRQVPVGLFEEKVKDESQVFPGKKGAIDLCAFLNDSSAAIFELKKKDNNKVGAISELIFYSNVIRDVQSGLVTYEKEKCAKFENRLMSTKGLKSFILATKLHPLIDTANVFKLLNSAYEQKHVKFGYVKYKSLLDAELKYW